MNKAELVVALASATGMTKSDASRAVNELFDPETGIISKAISAGEKVTIPGFGTFQAQSRAARQGRNPRTGELVSIPASRTPSFRAWRNLKLAVGGHHGDPQTDPPPPTKKRRS